MARRLEWAAAWLSRLPSLHPFSATAYVPTCTPYVGAIHYQAGKLAYTKAEYEWLSWTHLKDKASPTHDKALYKTKKGTAVLILLIKLYNNTPKHII
jgi:hypothetical protein